MWLDNPSCTPIFSHVFPLPSCPTVSYPLITHGVQTPVAQSTHYRMNSGKKPMQDLEEGLGLGQGNRVLHNWSTVWFGGKGRGLQAGKYPWTCRSLTLGKGNSKECTQGRGPSFPGLRILLSKFLFYSNIIFCTSKFLI